ncbi:MAG: hypothetical protein KC502_16875, partial [Myxococcales bacterium]|nr:hypothetical protein [Myxococcales bacterium]
MRCLRTSAMCSAGLTLLVLTAVALPSLGAPPTARIEAVNSEPKPDKKTDISALQAQISDKPRDRKARFRLVMALRAAGRLQQALTAARAWRAHDAYNLLVVRLIGDLHAALGDRHAALRSWSSVVELLPNDASAHRALASALKQAGAISAACQRLARAVELHPDDTRLRFESADCSHRLGQLNQAKLGFEAIAANDKTPKLIRAPTLQRLAQVYAQLARGADKSGDRAAATELRAKRAALTVPGGTNSDLKVFLTWDTDRSDIDLWVVTPKGERIWYSHRKGK